MADVTVSIQDRDVVGSRLVRRAIVTFTAGYAVAGETLDKVDFEVSEFKWVQVDGQPSIDDAAVSGALVTQDADAPVIRVVGQNGVLIGTDDLSSTTLAVTVYGV